MEVNISAIIPVYGVEDYLPRCLRSLEEQTIFDRLEVILIDDGSPDRCGVLCDEFAARHPRNVRVIHKENGGVSTARNAGLEAATGNYYLFLDSDDFLREDACEILAKAAQDSCAPTLSSSANWKFTTRRSAACPAPTRRAASSATRRSSTRWPAANRA